jgi:hypothetical protein
MGVVNCCGLPLGAVLPAHGDEQTISRKFGKKIDGRQVATLDMSWQNKAPDDHEGSLSHHRADRFARERSRSPVPHHLLAHASFQCLKSGM